MSKLLIISRLHSRHYQRGVVLPLFAVGMLAIIGIVGVSIDVGHVFLNKTRLQNSLDSAALSGARTLMLSDDVAAASADARAVFGDHLDGEMGNLDASNLILQYSDTLDPFIAEGSSPRFVRAVFQRFSTNLTLSSVLPNVEESISISGSAVAGPIPVGYAAGGTTCDIAPLLMCEIPNLSDCSDRPCRFTLHPVANSESSNNNATSFSGVELSACGEESTENQCEPEYNYLPMYLGCTSNACVRENFAGSFDSCLTQDATVGFEQIATPIHIVKGLMTRFGEYHSSLNAARFPPDVVVTQNSNYLYEEYKRDVTSTTATGSSTNGGAPYRRVVVVPEVDCQEFASGQSAISIRNIHCLFLAEFDEENFLHFHGQFVNECEASGDQGEVIPELSTNYTGPTEVILYNDPNNDES